MSKQKTESKDKLKDTLDALNKKYGIGTISLLGDTSVGEYDVISTGSIAFDYLTLGVGGFVKGKLYELMGWEGVGKSTVCGQAVAECQKAGGTALYIDGEHALDKTYFKALGVDIVNLLISQPSHGEEGFSIAIDMINSGKIDLLIIDSDSSLIPKKVLDGEVGDSAIGRKAKLNSDVYPKMKSALVDNKTCVIVVSQYREKIGVMFGNPTVTQGGHALKFYTDCRIEIARSLAKENDVVFGNLTKVKCTKNKMFPPYRSSEFYIIYGKGIDRISEIITLLSELEIGKKWGESFTINGVKHVYKDFEKLISTDMTLYEKYRNQIIDKLKNPNICSAD